MAKFPRRCALIVFCMVAKAACSPLHADESTLIPHFIDGDVSTDAAATDDPAPDDLATDGAVTGDSDTDNPDANSTDTDSPDSNSAPTQNALHGERYRALASAPAWRKLLKVTQKSNNRFVTDILSDTFYLAAGSPPSPVDELQATVKALRSPATADGSHAQCRFPARLHWLKTKAPELMATLPQVNCPQLDAWVSQTSGKQFYLVHVSGYFANPASAFGHLLLRVGDGKSKRGLLDAGINFGARIPPSDGSLKYMMKGLFGGYTASFSTQEHYLQDKVYAGTESRDMWAYDLKLTTEQAMLFRYHLWELMDQPFKYFFLKKNCAYRVAEILDLVFDTDVFINESAPYYAPVELFNKLEAHNARNSNNTYTSVDFIPSHKRDTFKTFDDLNEEDARIANAFLREGAFAQQSVSVEALDFLLDYLDYKVQGADEVQSTALRSLKQDVIRLRLKQPARAEIPSEVSALLAPGGGPKPATVRLSVTERGGTADTHDPATRNNDKALELEISPFWYDLLDETRGSLIDSAFKALVLNVRAQNDELRFNQLTLLDVQKYTPGSAAIYGESTYAWRGAAALVNRAKCATFCPEASFSGSFGRSIAVESAALYATLDASFTSTLAQQKVGFSLGSLYSLPWRIRGRWNSAYNLYSKNRDDKAWKHELQLQRSIGQNHAIDISWAFEHSSELTLGYKFKW